MVWSEHVGLSLSCCFPYHVLLQPASNPYEPSDHDHGRCPLVESTPLTVGSLGSSALDLRMQCSVDAQTSISLRAGQSENSTPRELDFEIDVRLYITVMLLPELPCEAINSSKWKPQTPISHLRKRIHEGPIKTHIGKILAFMPSSCCAYTCLLASTCTWLGVGAFCSRCLNSSSLADRSARLPSWRMTWEFLKPAVT